MTHIYMYLNHVPNKELLYNKLEFFEYIVSLKCDKEKCRRSTQQV